MAIYGSNLELMQRTEAQGADNTAKIQRVLDALGQAVGDNAALQKQLIQPSVAALRAVGRQNGSAISDIVNGVGDTLAQHIATLNEQQRQSITQVLEVSAAAATTPAAATGWTVVHLPPLCAGVWQQRLQLLTDSMFGASASSWALWEKYHFTDLAAGNAKYAALDAADKILMSGPCGTGGTGGPCGTPDNPCPPPPPIHPTGGGTGTICPPCEPPPPILPNGPVCPMPPPPCPPNPPPPLKPPGPAPTCQLPPCPDFGAAFDCAIGPMPRMGSAGWCDTLDVTLGAIQRVSGQLMELLGKNVRTVLCATWQLPDELLCLIDSIPDSFSPAVVGTNGTSWSAGFIESVEGSLPSVAGASAISLRPLKSFLRLLAKAPASTIKEIALFAAECYGATVCFARSVTCDVPEVTVQLVFMKGIVRIFQRLRIGVDIPIWGTLDISIEWPQLESCLDYLISYSCPYKIPGVGEADEAFRKHLISPEVYRCWLMMNGVAPEVHEPVFRAGFTRPGPGERKQWVYRLRPDAVHPNQTYTDVDFALDLQRDGTDPAYARYLRDTLYRVFQLRELRQLLDANVATKDDILSALLAEGFSPEQAPVLRDMEWVLTERKREAEIQGYTPSRLAHLYTRGEANDTEVRDRMKSIGYTDEQAKRLMEGESRVLAADQHRRYAQQAETELTGQLRRGYQMGVIHPDAVVNSLGQLGAQRESIFALLSAWDLQHNLDMAREAIAGVKVRFESGEVDGIQAIALLESATMQTAYAVQTVGGWSAALTQTEKIARGQRVLSMLSAGNVSPEIAGVMLGNLGWDLDTAEVQVAMAEQKIAAARVRAEQGAVQSAQRAAAAAEKLALEGSDAQQVARSVLRQVSPVSSVTKWLRDYIVSEDWARNRLAALGLPPDVIDLEIRAVRVYQDAHQPKISAVKTPKPPPPPKGITEGALKAWLKDGQISVAAFTTQMLANGYEQGVIDLIITEVCDGKTASCVQTDGPQDDDLPANDSGGQPAQ